MAGNDQPGNEKQPSSGHLSPDDAERLASQFTPMWEEPSPANPPAVAVVPAPIPLEPAPPEPAPIGFALVGADPASVARPPANLPDANAQYAPPRALVSPQKTQLGLAPVSVDPEASRPPPAAVRPETAPVASQAAVAFEEPPRSGPNVDTVPPRSRVGKGRARGIVIGVTITAALLVAAAGLRTVLAPKGDEANTPSQERTEAVAPKPVATQAVPPAAAPPPPAAVTPPPPATAAADEAPPPPPPPADVAPPPAETAKSAHHDSSAAKAAVAPRPPKHVAPPPPPAPKPAPHHVTHAPSSPTPASGGSIVRESPF